MKKELEVKSHVLEMLKDLLMGNEGGKFKPKAISIEVITPHKGKGGLDELLEKASEENPVHAEPDGDEYCEGGMAKKYSRGGEVEGEGLDEPGGDVEEMDPETVTGDNYEVEKKPKMSLKEFLKSHK